MAKALTHSRSVVGRPPRTSGRDSERTKEIILRQATREFSTKGFDGARVDNIAARCKLSKNSLYYHFKSKEGLITAVLENMYRELRERQEPVAPTTQDVREDMCSIVNHTFRAFVDKPEIIRLLNEENLHKGAHIRKSPSIRQLYNPLLERIAAVLKRGEEENLFRPGLDAVHVYLTLSSLAYHFLSNSYTLGFALDRDLSSSDALAIWGAHINEVILTFCQRADISAPARTREALSAG